MYACKNFWAHVRWFLHFSKSEKQKIHCAFNIIVCYVNTLANPIIILCIYRESFMEVMNKVEDWLLYASAVKLKTMIDVNYDQYYIQCYTLFYTYVSVYFVTFIALYCDSQVLLMCFAILLCIRIKFINTTIWLNRLKIPDWMYFILTSTRKDL